MKVIGKFIKDLKIQITCDYHNHFHIFLLESIGTFFSILASLSLALLGADANLLFVLSGYLIGSVTYAIASIYRYNSFLLLLSISYTIINLIGLAKILF